MWAPSEPPAKRPRVLEEVATPPSSPYKKVIKPEYLTNYIGVGDWYWHPEFPIKILRFHPVPETPTKVSEQLVIRK